MKLKLSSSNDDDDVLIDDILEFFRGFCIFNLRHKSSFKLVLIVKETQNAEILLNVLPAENILDRVKYLLPPACSKELTFQCSDSFQAIYASKHFDKSVNKLKTKKRDQSQSYFLFLADGIPFSETNAFIREVGSPFFIESSSNTGQNGIISNQWNVLILNLLYTREEFVSVNLLKKKLW